MTDIEVKTGMTKEQRKEQSRLHRLSQVNPERLLNKAMARKRELRRLNLLSQGLDKFRDGVHWSELYRSEYSKTNSLERQLARARMTYFFFGIVAATVSISLFRFLS